MLACEKQFNQKLYYTLCSDSTKMKYHFVKAVAAAILTNTCNNSVTSLKDLLTSSLLILAYTVLILIIFLKFRLLLALLNAMTTMYIKLFLKTFCPTILNFFTESVQKPEQLFLLRLTNQYCPNMEITLAHCFNITITCLEAVSTFYEFHSSFNIDAKFLT